MQFVANSRILFQGDANDLWYSDDLGDTWTAVFSVATLAGSLIGPYKVTWFNNLVLSATTGSADGEIHISRDNGSTWEHVHSEASFLPRSIEYDPITDRIVYIENGLNPICRAIDGAFNGAQDVIDVTFNVADGPSSNNLLNLAYPR
jgi:hypothetical protein